MPFRSPWSRLVLARARAARRRGDAAREASDWAGAAAAYRDHLDRAPDDFAIHVQLGHAARALGRFDMAEAAYAHARALRPDDADLALHLGHFARERGDLAAACAAYARSAALGAGAEALRELHEPALDPHIGPVERELLDQAAAAATAWLDARCSEVRVAGTCGLIAAGEGQVLLAAGGCRIDFEPLPGGAPASLLTIELDPPGLATLLDGTIEVAAGDELGRSRRLGLRARDGGCAQALLVRPADRCMLRWRAGALRRPLTIRAVRLEPLGAAELDALVARSTDAGVAEAAAAIRGGTIADVGTALRVAAAIVPVGAALGADYRRELDYPVWADRHITMTSGDRIRIAAMDAALIDPPSFSFVLPVYDPPPALLAQCLESLLGQTYPHFELCIADDGSTDPEVRHLLQRYAADDPRIRLVLRAENGHIAASSNSALALARGIFVALIDHDDLVPAYALSVVAHYTAQHRDAGVFFSDEDKIDQFGNHYDPYFKTCFDRFLILGHNMVSHLGVYRRALVERVGGFRVGFEGSQDYDLLLRCLDVVGEEGIVHIPHVLYHWRAIPGSTAMSADQKHYAAAAARRAVGEHLVRMGAKWRSVPSFSPGLAGIAATEVPDTAVSIVIPTRDRLDLLRACVGSIEEHGRDGAEIIIVDNDSVERETLEWLDAAARRPGVRVLRHPGVFDYPAINNAAAAIATGTILCFLNNDTEVLAPGWLDRARALLAMPEVGAVGARLLYPDGTLQHFGITLGMYRHRVAGMMHTGIPGDRPGYFATARLIRQFSAVTGACLFVRATDFASVGGFDPALRVAYNDVDLCLRLRARGLKVVADPDILLLHRESRSRGDDFDGPAAARLNTEAAIMRARWSALLDDDPFFSPNLSLDSPDFMPSEPPRVALPFRR